MGFQAAVAHDILSRIIRSKSVDLEDVLILRRQVWPDGRISRSEAEMLFRIDTSLDHPCAEWTDLLVETITGYLLDGGHPKGHVSDADADWFERQILADGVVKGSSELETLVSVLENARYVPHRLEMLALESVAVAVLDGDRDIVVNGGLERGVIGDPEAALMRRILYAEAGTRDAAISFDEAQFLVQLNDETANGTVCPAWTALYVTTLSNYLLTQDVCHAPTRAELAEIDAWLNRPSAGIVGFLGATLHKPSRRPLDAFIDGYDSYFTGDSPMERIYQARENDPRSTASPSADANWLIKKLQDAAALTANDRALLRFLKAGDYAPHPDLASAIEGAR